MLNCRTSTLTPTAVETAMETLLLLVLYIFNQGGLDHILECVPLTISYHLYILRISKVSSILHHGSVGRVHSEECYFIFKYTYLTYFFCFSSKDSCFYYFHFFFWWTLEFPQQKVNQLKTEIGDKKLSVELYASVKYFLLDDPPRSSVLVYYSGSKIRF